MVSVDTIRKYAKVFIWPCYIHQFQSKIAPVASLTFNYSRNFTSTHLSLPMDHFQTVVRSSAAAHWHSHPAQTDTVRSGLDGSGSAKEVVQEAVAAAANR